ncbi:MAG TPA: hypothetical protein VMB21_15410 [Candidatus Limnocylindria bacterium]|jgi:hypothetical protein|nr:hypothetical protein [Candidatus Limnocylindria bacterium]
MNAHEEKFRPVTTTEKAVLGKLLEAKFPGWDILAQQLVGLQGKQIDAEGSLRLLVTTAAAAPVSGVVVEARYPDLDTKSDVDAHVNILLHVAAGKLSVLEIYKDDGSTILKAPNPTELQLFSRYNP